MPKSFKQRLQVLEALEQESPPPAERLAVDALTDAAVLEQAFEGLRACRLWYTVGEMTGIHDPYWQGIAERTTTIMYREQLWVVPVYPEECQLVLDALRRGVLLVRIRADHWPTWYDFSPPEPYPPGWYDWPAVHAGRRVSTALGGLERLLDRKELLPQTQAALEVWLLHRLEDQHAQPK